jgi:hypothetical protein
VFRSPLGSPFRFPPLKNGGVWQSLPEEGASHFETEHFNPAGENQKHFSNHSNSSSNANSKPSSTTSKSSSKGSSKGSAVASFSNIGARECALVSAYEGFGREAGWSFRSSNRSNSGNSGTSSSRGSAHSSSRNVLLANTVANASTSSVRASVLLQGRGSVAWQLSRQASSRLLFTLLLLST